MNTTEMIAFCRRMMEKYGEDVVLDWRGSLGVYDFDNNLLETIR